MSSTIITNEGVHFQNSMGYQRWQCCIPNNGPAAVGVRAVRGRLLSNSTNFHGRLMANPPNANRGTLALEVSERLSSGLPIIWQSIATGPLNDSGSV